MQSLIDPTQPQYGSATTESVRTNFGHAKDEIEALAEQIRLSGLTFGDALVLDPFAPYETAWIEHGLPVTPVGVIGYMVKLEDGLTTDFYFTGDTLDYRSFVAFEDDPSDEHPAHPAVVWDANSITINIMTADAPIWVMLKDPFDHSMVKIDPDEWKLVIIPYVPTILVP